MKKSMNLKTLAVALFSTFGIAAFAQVTAPSWSGNMVSATTGVNTEDTVTIGSVMPYQVVGDPNMHLLRSIGVLNKSNFTWAVPIGGTLRAISGANGSTPAATDTVVSVSWESLGAQNIQVTEVPQVVSGPSFSCTATAQTLNVVVIARPTAALSSASASGCSVAGTTVTIPYTLTGKSPFKVTYRIAYTSLSGTTTDVVTSNTITVAGSGDLSYAVGASAYGKYDVYISAVSDRISEKSGVLSQAADLPSAPLTFYAYPTPATQPIKHVKNL
jgi:hypothetical protein